MEHSKDVKKYSGTLQELAEDIFNMRYDSVAEFFEYAKQKLEKDSLHDLLINHLEVSKELKLISNKMNESKEIAKSLWKICEKYMLK